MQVQIRDFVEAITSDNLGGNRKATNGKVETHDFILAAVVSIGKKSSCPCLTLISTLDLILFPAILTI